MTAAGPKTEHREPRAAYIHVPFCRHRCGYCNFTVIAGRDDAIDGYVAALDRELAGLGRPREVDTLFLGGGTPTHLARQPLMRLLELVTRAFSLAAGHEFSVEANPRDVTPEIVDCLADAGVNRISLGVQSFAPRKLTLLERDHSAAEIRAAVAAARRRIADVSLDLIFGVPGESLAEWQADLDAALDLAPEHVSTYGLTFEKGARFWSRRERGELQSVEEETERRLYETAIDSLTGHGFDHYEVSNFARPGHTCRHNITYWTGREYFAAGPGAARYVGGVREMNHRSTTTWMRRLAAGESPVQEREALDAEDRARERLVFGLRMLRGIDTEEFRRETGFDVTALVGDPLRRYRELGFLQMDGPRLHLTRAGLLVSDSLWPEFLVK